jgi:hypothetical protein
MYRDVSVFIITLFDKHTGMTHIKITPKNFPF